METPANAVCPFCGHGNEVVVDTDLADSRFITDCEMCCRPFEVRAACEEGEILALEVQVA